MRAYVCMHLKLFPTHPSTPRLPPSIAAPSFASVVDSRLEQPQSTLAVQDGACIRVYAIVTVSRAVQSYVVIEYIQLSEE